MRRENIEIKNIGNYFFYVQNGVILDKKCPSCQKFLLKNEKKCYCGFSLEADKTLSQKTLKHLIYLFFSLFIIFIFLCFKLFSVAEQKLNFASVSPVQIQLLGNMRNSPLKNHIKKIYIRQGRTNELLILIEPSVWNTITEQKKKKILLEIQEKWQRIYRVQHPDSKEPPKVFFANL